MALLLPASSMLTSASAVVAASASSARCAELWPGSLELWSWRLELLPRWSLERWPWCLELWPWRSELWPRGSVESWPRWRLKLWFWSPKLLARSDNACSGPRLFDADKRGRSRRTLYVCGPTARKCSVDQSRRTMCRLERPMRYSWPSHFHPMRESVGPHTGHLMLANSQWSSMMCRPIDVSSFARRFLIVGGAHHMVCNRCASNHSGRSCKCRLVVCGAPGTRRLSPTLRHHCVRASR
jgi:hypothetical protein